MKTNTLFGKVTAFVAIAMVGLVVSCKDNEKLNGTDAANAVSESLTDGYYEDADDMSLVAVNDAPAPARAATSVDERLNCGGAYIVVFSDGSNQTAGSFTVDFGTGCTDSKGNVRMGKITVEYSGGPIGSEGFKVIMTFTDYSINGIKLEGTRTVTRLSSTEFKHSIKLENGKATWPDATYATRNANFIRTVDSNAGTVTITGDASGTSRNGKSYSMEIKEALVYKTECAISNKIYMAVQGIKLYTNTSTNKTLTIDYGTGDCDRIVALTVGRLSFNYTVYK